jgi:serine/threonine-protein kinase
VLPFVNVSSDPENEYLSDGITDELIDALAKIEGLRVASRTSVFSLKNKPQDVRAIGVLLGVSVVLEGTVRKLGNQLRVTAQITSTDDGRLLWSQRYDRQLADVFALQDEIAQTIVATLRAKSLGVSSRRQKRYTESITAYALYLRGRHAWNKRSSEGVAEAIDFFQQAIEADPQYALAYTGLSDAYALHVDYRSVPVHEGFARAREYAERALAIDESLAEAHTSLGWVLFIYEWKWAEAARELKRAIELDHRYATAHQWYAALLAARGDMQEALIEGHTAQDLDPNSVSARRSLGYMYYYARRYDRARYHMKRALTLAPGAEETYRVLGLNLVMEGRLLEAEETLRDALSLPGASSYTLATLGYALGRAKRVDEAREILAQLEARRREHYVSPVALATVCLGVGDYEEALTWAERSCDERRGWLAYMDVNPILDPLRGKTRFERLRRRMGL